MRILIFILVCASLETSAIEQAEQLPVERPITHESVKTVLHAGWESRYVSEGRDSLDGDSLLATSFELESDKYFGGVWYGQSPDQDYDELQMMLGLSKAIDTFEFHVVYAHIRLPYADLHDNEIELGVAWSGLPLGMELATVATYSFDSEGSFWEFALTREIASSDRLALVGTAVFGVNQGYVPDGHDGANHIALQFEAGYVMTRSVSVTANAGYSWALRVDPALPGDDQLIDFFHAGVNIYWAF